MTGSFRAIESTIESPDSPALYWQASIPPNPKGTVSLIHGICEHSGRYIHLKEALNRQGYALFALDLRGHGRSEGPRGEIISWEEYSKDVAVFLDITASKRGKVPHFLLGHSMGALVALGYQLENPQSNFEGTILSSPPFRIPWNLGSWQSLVMRPFSWMVPKGTFPLPLQPHKITGDPDEVERIKQDPLIHRRVSFRLLCELLRQSSRLRQWHTHMSAPFLLFHGMKDSITNVKGTQGFHHSVPEGQSTLNLYPGMRHECMNETDRAGVFEDILAWLDARVTQTQ